MTNEELAALVQEGHEERMGELWGQVERLVAWKANRVLNALGGCGGVDFDDLYDTGYLAMVEAVKTYKPESGPFHAWFLYYLKTAFAAATGYRTATQRNDPLRNAVSLSTPLSDEEGGELAEIVPDPAGEAQLRSIEDRIFLRELREALDETLDSLPEDLADTLRRRYYLGQTIAEAAQERGVYGSTIAVQEGKALRTIRYSRYMPMLQTFHDFNYFSGTGATAYRHSGMSVQERYLIRQENKAGL